MGATAGSFGPAKRKKKESKGCLRLIHACKKSVVIDCSIQLILE